MGGTHRQHISCASAWTPECLAEDRDGGDWDIHLGAGEIDDLLAALDHVNAAGVPLAGITFDNFPLRQSDNVLSQLRRSLSTGRGFSLLHGFPVEDQTLSDIERMYWGFCAHLGHGVTQNSDGSLIHYVTEGHLRPNQGTRGVGNPGKVSLHVDLADCVSLLCVRQAADSPPSRLSSSTTLHNELLSRAPESLDRLYRGFEWDRQGEHDITETPTTGYLVPFFSEKDGNISCRYNRNWMMKAAQRGGGDFSVDDKELLDLIDELTHQNCLEFDFQPGDIQFANNYKILHGRAPHTPAQTDEQTRLLMRIWFDANNLGPWSDEAIVRYGIIQHGKLGWSAADTLDGLDDKTHYRRAIDNAPDLYHVSPNGLSSTRKDHADLG